MAYLILLTPLAIVLLMAWRQWPRARASRVIAAEVERHRAVLRGKWLKAHDEYGVLDEADWGARSTASGPPATHDRVPANGRSSKRAGIAGEAAVTEPGRGSQRVGDATAEEPAQAAAPTRRVAAATSGFTVLIGGRPRAGKSRLAARLSDEFGWPVVNGDLLRAALRAPDCGGLRPLHARNATARALLAYGKQRVGTSKIIDGEQFSPSAVAKHHDPAHWVVAFLGFPRIGIEQLLGRIRDYEFIHKGWTTEKTDDELREACSQWIEAGVAEKAACERLGLTFVDTSKNFDASIDRAFDDLCAAIRRMIDHGTVA